MKMGASEQAVWAAMREHTKHCATCTAALQEAERLQGLNLEGSLYPCDKGLEFVLKALASREAPGET